MTNKELLNIIEEELQGFLNERCQKGYKTHSTTKTKKMYGKTYRNCVKADEGKVSLSEIVEEDFKIDPNIHSGVKQLEKIKLFTMHRDAAVNRMKAVLAATNDERTSDFMNSMIRQLMTKSRPGTRFSKPHLSEKQLSALERVENRLGIQVPPEQADLPTREEVREASDYYHNVIQHQRNAEMLAKRNNKEIDEIIDEEIDLYLNEKKRKEDPNPNRRGKAKNVKQKK